VGSTEIAAIRAIYAVMIARSLAVRIVHFLHGRANPNGTNGGDRVIYNLAKHSGELGAHVFVFGLSEKPPLTISGALVQNFTQPRDPLSLPPSLTRALLEIKPDIVHFHGVYTPRNVRFAQWLRHRGIPYAISPHGGLMPEVIRRGWIRKVTYLGVLGGRFCRGASFIHCISEAEAKSVRPYSGDVPAVVAAHGLEGTNLESLDRDALRRQYPQLRHKRIFGFLGRLDPAHKGLDMVVEACARIRPSLTNAVIILAGPEWKNRTQGLRSKIVELGLQNTVLFVGPRMAQDKFNFLASCDVFIHPSRWEAGVPFSVLDALELGKPCLVSNGSFFGNFFQQHLAGVQVPPTPDGVANGLRRMAEVKADDLEAMGARGRQAVLQEFSWERTAEKLLRAYDSRHSWSSQEPHGTTSAVA
jgi:glycosyltransferase involved in cell wall biosynthesis